MRLKAYEKPLLFLASVLGLLLLAAVYTPGLLLIEKSSPAAKKQGSGNLTTSEFAPAHQGTKGSGDQASVVNANKGSSTTTHPTPRLLCAPTSDITTLHNDRVAVAADRAGHFTLYGSPDPASGLPGKDSYELLRGCVKGYRGKTSYASETLLNVETGARSPIGRPTGGVTASAGDEHLISQLRSRNGSLESSYDFVRGIRLRQRISLKHSGMVVSYEVSNSSGSRQRVNLRSLASPPPALGPLSREQGGRLPLFKIMGTSEGRITKDTVVKDTKAYKRVLVPRAGAASDATAVWRPTLGSAAPSEVAFAGYYRLSGIPFLYDASGAYQLPSNAALAAYWTGLNLGPGDSKTLSWTYTQPGRG